jgi:Glycosyltransferases involved in cell wall biogenesis
MEKLILDGTKLARQRDRVDRKGSMKTPFLSVIVPVYNYAHYVSQTITSILTQGFLDFEVIVVNDCSTDNTDEVIRSFAQDPRLVYLKNEKNMGGHSALERGFGATRGQYIAAIAADDYYLPDAFQKLYIETSKKPAAPFVYGKYYLVNKDNAITNMLQHPGWDARVRERRTSELADLMRYDCYVGMTTAFVNKLVFDAYPFDKAMRLTDNDFWLRMAEDGLEFRFIDEYLAAVRPHGEQHPAGPNANTTGDQLRDQIDLIERYVTPRNYPRLAEYEADILKQLQGRVKTLENFPEILQPLAPRIDAATKRLTKISAHGRKKALAGPTVSVIIPTYNRPDLLTDAIESVCAQTFKDFEIIVVNDCGKDVEVVCAPYRDCANITYIRHGRNRGLGAARNSGIKVARGEYLCYLDDDDIFYPNHLETLLTFMEEHGVFAAYTDSYEAIQKEMNGVRVTVKRRLLYSCDLEFNAILVNNLFPSLCMMHRRSCIDKIGFFDETLTTHEDWEMWIRLAMEFKPRHIATVTSEYRRVDTGGNMTSYNLADFARTRAIIYERYKNISSPEIRILQQRALDTQQAMNNTTLPVEQFMEKTVQMIEKGNTSGGLAFYDQHRSLCGTIPELLQFDTLVNQVRKNSADNQHI